MCVLCHGCVVRLWMLSTGEVVRIEPWVHTDSSALSHVLWIVTDSSALSPVLWIVQELNHGRLAMIAAVGTCSQVILLRGGFCVG